MQVSVLFAPLDTVDRPDEINRPNAANNQEIRLPSRLSKCTSSDRARLKAMPTNPTMTLLPTCPSPHRIVNRTSLPRTSCGPLIL